MTSFTVTQTLTDEQISDVLCSALEGGSNHWYLIDDFVVPTTWEFDSEPKRPRSGHWPHDYPLNPGGALMISSPEDPDQGIKRLDAEAIQRGLAVLAEKYPHHLLDLLEETGDAYTGDALLQCSLFGDIVYG